MKKAWEYGTLEDAVKKASSNISLNKVKNDEGEYPLFSAKGFNKNISFFQQEKEYLGIIKDGAGIGRVSKHPAKSSIVATMQYLIPNDGFDIGFIEYFLNGIDFEKHRNGSTIPHIYFKDYKSERFPILELPEQKRIVSILDKVFSLIERSRNNAEQNLNNAKELFESYLNRIFEEKGEDWEFEKLGKLGTLTSSKRIYKKEYVDNGIPFYRSKEIKELGNNRDITLELFITEKRYNEIKQKFGVPKKGDILLTAVGTIGEMYVVREYDKFYFKDGNIMWLKNFNTLNTYYLKYALTSFVEKLKSLSRGAAYSALTIEKLKEYSIPIPPIETQRQIVAQLDKLQAETKKLESIYQQKIDDLEELKKSVLQKAFNGEL